MVVKDISENVFIKDWRRIDFSFGLIYPNIYTVGMSSYSIRLLYYLINSYDNIACERIFLPEGRITFPASKDLTPENNLRSLENKIMPKEFDILGFSLHFENNFKNILWILDKAKIPITFEERLASRNDEHIRYPLIIGGGPVVTSNPISLGKIFDLLFIGDAENNLDLFFKLYQTYNLGKISFYEFLDRAQTIEGIYIPSLNNKVERAVLKNLDESPVPTFQLTTKTSKAKLIFGRNFLIETSRGCPFQCKFCISSFHNSPFRNRSFENIVEVIDKGIKSAEFEAISLIGSCISSHPKFYQICEYIIGKGKRLTIPSIRIDHITKELIQILESGGIKTITIAPEAGSENLRYQLGKVISNEKILSVLTQLKNSKIKNVKFYFLIGLPNETEEDIDQIINLLKEIADLGFNNRSLRVSINPFIPKLNTPLQKEIMFYTDRELNKLVTKFQKIERELKPFSSIKLKVKNFKVIVKNARLQTMISLGNQEISNLLIYYYQNGANFGALKKAENDLQFQVSDYLLKIRDGYNPWKF
ncbi:MAG: B12-binding domain-containing radical SAM protein [Promethearchaeota archaeon]|jgi:radical SAM superfamily enzyme YgiQ (UPF0313 family)